MSDKWELLLPVVACMALFSGLATAVEAAAITALYALIVESLDYRDFSITRDLPRVMKQCGCLRRHPADSWSCARLYRLPDRGTGPGTIDRLGQSPWHSPLVFLLALNIFLLIVGCLMDISRQLS